MGLLVADLIDYDCTEWKGDIVRSTFDAQVYEIILATSLSRRWPEGELYWRKSTEGTYTVRSGYWLAKLGHESGPDMPASMVNDKIWKIIWSNDGPPKLRHFLWKACKGSMAVKERLEHRHIVHGTTCPVCNAEFESVIHTLLRLLWKYGDIVTLRPI